MTTQAGENLYRVASFIAPGTTASTFKLGQVKPDSSFDTWNNDYIATVNAYGSQEDYYSYNQEDGNWYESNDVGFIPDTTKIANNVEFPINKGLIVSSSKGATFTYTGALMGGDTELYTIENDITYTGNFTPDTLTLGDLVVDENFDTWNNDYLATINLYGSQEDYYSYNQEDGNWYESNDVGFISETAKIANNVPFEPNMTFLVSTSNGATINIPSPINQ